MAPTASFDWIFYAAAGGLALLGAWVLYRALFRDRARGRRRCPACWYSMQGVPGLRCPECGKEARREQSLFATRRRWRRAVLASLALVVAAGLYATPAVRSGNWPSLVPSTVLVLGTSHWELGLPPPSSRVQMLPAPPSDWRGRLGWELLNRFSEGRLWDWQTAMVLRRAARGDPARPLGSLGWSQYYEQFPAELGVWEPALAIPPGAAVAMLTTGAPARRPPTPSDANIELARRTLLSVYVTVVGPEAGLAYVRSNENERSAAGWLEFAQPGREGTDDWLSSVRRDWGWTDGWVGPFPCGEGSVQVMARRVALNGVTGRTVELWRLPITLPVPSVQAPAPRDSPRLESAMATGLDAGFTLERFYEGRPLVWLKIEGPVTERPVTPSPLTTLISNLPATLGLRLEVLREGVVVASGRAWWHGLEPRRVPSYPGGELIELRRIDQTPRSIAEDARARWTLRLTGDPAVAVLDPECTGYWHGAVEVPLRLRPGGTPWPSMEEWNADPANAPAALGP